MNIFDSVMWVGYWHFVVQYLVYQHSNWPFINSIVGDTLAAVILAQKGCLQWTKDRCWIYSQLSPQNFIYLLRVLDNGVGKIDELELGNRPIYLDQNIGRLKIPMDDAYAMQIYNHDHQLYRQLKYFSNTHSSVVQIKISLQCELMPCQIIHIQIMGIEIVIN